MGVALHDAFLTAYNEYSDAIFRHCFYRVSSRERAKELTQEAFMRTWKYIADGNSIGNIRAFLYRVTNNLIIDEYRKKKESSLDAMMEEGTEIGVEETGRIRDRIDGKITLGLLDKIETKYRQALIMRYIDDLSPEEISKVTNETPNTVSVHIHRGLKQVRKIIETENENSLNGSGFRATNGLNGDG